MFVYLVVTAVILHTLDNLDELGVDLFPGLNAADLLNDVFRSVLRHDLGKLHRLLVLLDALEAESHLDGVEQVLDGLIVLCELGSGADESLLARQLAERSTTHSLDGILQVGVTDSLDDLVDVGGLSLLVDLVLGGDEVLSLHQSATDLSHDLLVLKGIVDGALSPVVTVVGSGSVASIDGEELALDKGGEVVNPVNALDAGDADVLKGSAVNDPLEEFLERHIEAGVGVLSRHNSVNSRVGVAGTQVVVLETRGVGVAGVLDVLSESVGSANSVLAGNDVQWRLVVGSAVDTLGDDGGDELEDIGANGASNNVGGTDLLNEVLLVRLGVDGAVVGDGVLGGAFGAHLDDLVRGSGVDQVDNGVVDIGEDDLVARVVEEASNKATAWGDEYVS